MARISHDTVVFSQDNWPEVCKQKKRRGWAVREKWKPSGIYHLLRLPIGRVGTGDPDGELKVKASLRDEISFFFLFLPFFFTGL